MLTLDGVLVRAEALDCLEAFVLGEEAGRCDVAVKLPVDEGGGDDSDEATEEKNSIWMLVFVHGLVMYGARVWESSHLPGVEQIRLDMPKTVGQSGRHDRRNAVHTIPKRNAIRLLHTSIPQPRNDCKQRHAPGLEQAQEEAAREQPAKVVACSHARLCEAPAENEGGHEDAVGHLDDQEGREGLPGELSHGGHGTDEGVLVSRETGVLLEVEDGPGAEDGLVDDLRAWVRLLCTLNRG